MMNTIKAIATGEFWATPNGPYAGVACSPLLLSSWLSSLSRLKTLTVHSMVVLAKLAGGTR
jgi:hypothetical protein